MSHKEKERELEIQRERERWTTKPGTTPLPEYASQIIAFLIIGVVPLLCSCLHLHLDVTDSRQLRPSYSGTLLFTVQIWSTETCVHFTEERKSLCEKGNSNLIEGHAFTEMIPTFKRQLQEQVTYTADSYLHVQMTEMSKTTFHPQAFPENPPQFPAITALLMTRHVISSLAI